LRKKTLAFGWDRATGMVMKKKHQSQKPTRCKLSILRQICKFVPNHLVPQLARETGVEGDARTYTPWSHVLTLLFAQLTHSLGLNDVCDALALHSGPLSAIRGATAPKRNTLSNANRKRDPVMAEKLFWQTLEHLQNLCPGFGRGRRRRFAFRFKRMIHLVDSTTLQLVANCMDWAKHRRRKAAAKCHLRLNLQSFLPRFAIVDTARHSDAKKAWELCAGLLAGEIVIFDKAYLDLLHLFELFKRGVSCYSPLMNARRGLSRPEGQDVVTRLQANCTARTLGIDISARGVQLVKSETGRWGRISSTRIWGQVNTWYLPNPDMGQASCLRAKAPP